MLRDFGWSDAKKFVTTRKNFFLPNRKIFYRTVCYHTCNKRICAVVRFCYYSYDYRPNWTALSPITITYYAHNEFSLTCEACEIWTALPLWKINLRAVKSWFDSPSSEKVKFPPFNFLAAVFSSEIFFSLSAWKIMIGQSRQGLLVVYDCMANASLS